MSIYTLRIESEDGILGAIGLVDWQDEQRIEIKLLSRSKENIGRQKIYEGIAGCLIAFACRRAILKYGPEALHGKISYAICRMAIIPVLYQSIQDS